MKNQNQNIFIVENDGSISINLHKIIEEKFGTLFTICHFVNAAEAIRKIDMNTKIILLDSDYFGETGNKIINFVKNINPSTKIIIQSKNVDLVTSIEAYILKEKINATKTKAKKRLLNPKVSRIVHYPAYHLHQKYGVRPVLFYVFLVILILFLFIYFGMGKMY
jgi:DNA-binding NtrC family response regulator